MVYGLFHQERQFGHVEFEVAGDSPLCGLHETAPKVKAIKEATQWKLETELEQEIELERELQLDHSLLDWTKYISRIRSRRYVSEH